MTNPVPPTVDAVTRALRWVWAKIVSEPVLLGGAVMGTVQAVRPEMSEAGMLAWTAWITLFQRAFSTPQQMAEKTELNAIKLGKVLGANTEKLAQVRKATKPTRKAA